MFKKTLRRGWVDGAVTLPSFIRWIFIGHLVCARCGVWCQDYGVTRPSGEIDSSKSNAGKWTIVTVTSTIKEEFVVVWVCVIGRLDLESFPGAGVMGLNHEAIVSGAGRLSQAENWVYKGPVVSAVERVCVFREVKGDLPVLPEFPQGGHWTEATPCRNLRVYEAFIALYPRSKGRLFKMLKCGARWGAATQFVF